MNNTGFLISVRYITPLVRGWDSYPATRGFHKVVYLDCSNKPMGVLLQEKGDYYKIFVYNTEIWLERMYVNVHK